VTILTEAELKRRMGMTIDPNSVPRHDGGDLGCMEGQIEKGSETRVVEQGHGRRGTEVYAADELGDPRFYGSATVISIKDDRPLPQATKKAPPAPQVESTVVRSPAELLAMMGLTKRR
jgi:hypothetical protein